MTWDGTGYGAHTETAAPETSTTWYHIGLDHQQRFRMHDAGATTASAATTTIQLNDGLRSNGRRKMHYPIPVL